MIRIIRYMSLAVVAVLLNLLATLNTDAQKGNQREIALTSVWVVSDEGPDEEGEYVADGSGWYNKDGSGSIMWRLDIDLREVHDNPNLNGIWIRDNRGSGRNVGCTENNDPDDVTICTEWRANYGYEDVVAFRVKEGEGDRDDYEGDEVDRIAWADRAFQLRGSQEDYDQVIEADDPEEEFYSIEESDEEDGHLGDEDLDLDEVREAVAEMADSFAGSRDLFKGLEKSVAKEYEDGCEDCIEKSLNKFRRYAKMRRMDEEEIDEFTSVADLFVAALQQASAGEEGDQHEVEGGKVDRIAWADRAFQLRGSQEDYDLVMEADDPEEEFYAIEEGDEVAETRDRIAWADRAFQLRGSQEDYDLVMEADDPEEEFYAIEEGNEEDGNLGDEDLDLDEVREAVAEMADSFVGSRDLFKGLEKSVAKEYEDGCEDCIEKSLNKFRRYAKMRRMDEEEIDGFTAVADLFVAALQQTLAGEEGGHHEDEGDDHGEEGDHYEDEGDDHGDVVDHQEEEWSSGPNSVRLVLKSITDDIVEVDIEVAQSEPISGWSMLVNYDSDILKFKSFTPKFVKGAFIPLSMESAEGVEVGGAVLGRNVAKSEGDGILGTVKLDIVGTLPSNISLAKPTFRGVDSDIILEQEPLEIAP